MSVGHLGFEVKNDFNQCCRCRMMIGLFLFFYKCVLIRNFPFLSCPQAYSVVFFFSYFVRLFFSFHQYQLATATSCWLEWVGASVIDKQEKNRFILVFFNIYVFMSFCFQYFIVTAWYSDQLPIKNNKREEKLTKRKKNKRVFFISLPLSLSNFNQF